MALLAHMPQNKDGKTMKAYDYDQYGDLFDILELQGESESKETNAFLHKCFKKHGVKNVFDISCGTGAQLIGLKRSGYKVKGSDLSEKMLQIAKDKCYGLGIRFKQADMRKITWGKNDAVISMFNSIGHLSKKGFDEALDNVSSNLKKGGIFAFDIFNTDFGKLPGAILPEEFIETVKEIEGITVIRFVKCKLNPKTGVLRLSYRTYVQDGYNVPDILEWAWDMQCYSPMQLTKKLAAKGFENITFYDEHKTKRAAEGLALSKSIYCTCTKG